MFWYIRVHATRITKCRSTSKMRPLPVVWSGEKKRRPPSLCRRGLRSHRRQRQRLTWIDGREAASPPPDKAVVVDPGPNGVEANLRDTADPVGASLRGVARAAASPRKVLVGNEMSLCWIGDVHAEFLETRFHAAIELSLHRPAAGIGALRARARTCGTRSRRSARARPDRPPASPGFWFHNNSYANRAIMMRDSADDGPIWHARSKSSPNWLPVKASPRPADGSGRLFCPRRRPLPPGAVPAGLLGRPGGPARRAFFSFQKKGPGSSQFSERVAPLPMFGAQIVRRGS